VQEKHTLDKLFMQLVIAVFWCNPFFWLIRKELKYIHEFIADKKALGDSGTEAFAAMILQSVYPRQFQSITNQFFQTSIKRRIFMLSQLKNPKVAYVSRVVALPIVAFLIFSFTIRTKEKINDIPGFNLMTINGNDTIPKKGKEISSIDVTKTKREITITYVDGTKEVMTENEAQERGLINNDYSNHKKTIVATKSPNSSIRLQGTGNSPLFVLDGKEVSKETVEKMDPNKIESINVLKGKDATDKYGNKGKDGAVEIKMKKQPTAEPVSLSLQENGEVMKGTVSNLQLQPNSVAGEIDLVDVQNSKATTDTTIKPNHVFTKTELEASVDKQEWRSHLAKQLVPFIIKASNDGIVPGNYTVNVRFIVHTDGSLSDVKALNDFGYGLANAAVKVVRVGPKWTPAENNKQKVNSYHTQPITFQIQEQ